MFRTCTSYQTLTPFKIWTAQKKLGELLAVADIVRQVLQNERHFDLGRGPRQHSSARRVW